jgi:rubrerythrin
MWERRICSMMTNNDDDESKNRCPLCGITMEEPEECQHCDFKRRDHMPPVGDV